MYTAIATFNTPTFKATKSEVINPSLFNQLTSDQIKKAIDQIMTTNKIDSMSITHWTTEGSKTVNFGQSQGTTTEQFTDTLINDASFIFLVAFSGGKDSIACVLHLLDKGVSKDRIILHHHEVDGGGQNLWDWKVTTQYCKEFAKIFGLKILFSRRDGGITREIFRNNEGRQSVSYQKTQDGDFITLESKKGSSTRMMFPAVSMDLNARWCSEVVKISVLSRVINNNPEYATGNFVVVTGERREESAKRSKYFEVEQHRCNTKKRTTWHWRPVIDWTEQDVWNAIKKHSVQVHPCYELGWSRCSCQTCIFGSSDIWASIAEINPEKIEKIAMIEKLTGGHTLYTKKKGRKSMPMDITEKVAKGTSLIPSDIDKEFWIKNATEQFTAPIVKENWTLPAGAFKESHTCGA